MNIMESSLTEVLTIPSTAYVLIILSAIHHTHSWMQMRFHRLTPLLGMGPSIL